MIFRLFMSMELTLPNLRMARLLKELKIMMITNKMVVIKTSVLYDIAFNMAYS